MHLTRRQFNSFAVTAAATAMTTNRIACADDPSSTGWIDAHVHVWNPDINTYPISDRFQKSDMQPPSFTADELFANCRLEGVTRIVLIQMSYYQYDHRYMNEVIAAYPGVFSGVAIVDYQAPDLVARMQELVDQGSRGFRLHSQGDVPKWLDDHGMNQLWKTAGENGWAVCPLVNPHELPIVAELCAKYPQTTVVVDHFGRVGVSGEIKAAELDSLCGLAKFKNAHVKTSAFYALGKKQPPYEDLTVMIRRVLDAFGPERLMWASDCPYQVQAPHTYAASISLIRDHCDFLTPSDRQWLLRGTAEKVFFG